MALKQERYKVQSAWSDVLLTVRWNERLSEYLPVSRPSQELRRNIFNDFSGAVSRFFVASLK
jgi:hypothetical protein